MDVACVLVAAALAAAGMWLMPAEDRLPVGVDVVAAVAGCAGLLGRRRFPVAVAVGLVVLSVVLPVVGGASAIALFTVAVHRKAAVAGAVTVLAVLTAPLEYLLWPGAAGPAGVLVASAGAAVVCLAVTGWGAVVRARRQLVLAWAERARQAGTEQWLRVERGRRAERERIAREMHDVLAHRLSLLSLHAGVLEYRRGLPPEKLAETAALIRAGAHQSLEDLREVIGLLRAPDGERDRPQPTLSDVPGLVEESRTAGLRLAYANRLDPAADIPERLGRTGYRIVQEALTNARKHAPPRAATRLELRGGPGEGLTVEAVNPLGVFGGTTVPGSGSGLVGLAERVSLAQGRLGHGPTPDGEFRLTAWLPWAT
ncbi:sensor histidine kinase [Streptomyces sp. NPDC087856]|uniref:sensor histidine kinase n=1 Tax=Streptomyces sp. NPDC087856 TaxID=3365811 RepID=UPI0037FD1A2E